MLVQPAEIVTKILIFFNNVRHVSSLSDPEIFPRISSLASLKINCSQSGIVLSIAYRLIKTTGSTNDWKCSHTYLPTNNRKKAALYWWEDHHNWTIVSYPNINRIYGQLSNIIRWVWYWTVVNDWMCLKGRQYMASQICLYVYVYIHTYTHTHMYECRIDEHEEQLLRASPHYGHF